MTSGLKPEELVDGTVPPVVELRVHGVGGSSPETILDLPHTQLVRGDKISGFYRAPGGRSALEAYSWGGLTSRSPWRAFWVLLAPFAFLNVAGWLLPPGSRRLGRFEDALVRWVALYATVMVALLVGQPALETIALKCPSDSTCVATDRWIAFVKSGPPGHRIVVAALFPLLILLALRWLARRSYRRYERGDDAATPGLKHGEPSLGDPGFWTQGSSFDQLARLHLAAGGAALGLVIAGSMWQMTTASHLSLLGTDLIGLLAWANAIWLIVVGVWAAAVGPSDPVPGWLRRLERLPRRRNRRAPHTSMLIASLLLTAVAVVAWIEPRDAGAATLNWYAHTNVLAAIFGAVVPVAILFILLFRQPERRQPMQSPLASLEDAEESNRDQAGIKMGFSGYGAAVSGLFGFLLAMTFLGALNGGIAAWVGAESFGRVDDFGAFVIACGALLAVLTGWQWTRAGRNSPTPEDLHPRWPGDAGTDPGELDESRRVWLAGIVRRLRLRTLISRIDRPLSWLVVVLTGVLVVEVAGEAWGSYTGHEEFSIVEGAFFLFSRSWFGPFWSWLEGAGGWLLIVGVPPAALWLLRRLYSDAESRKTVGIVWDIATFFPRWYHPFAPPSYPGRAVPELRQRIETLVGSGSNVILSAHSQGTVLALATVTGLAGSDTLPHVGLLTHGSPIGRLYFRFFPRHFAEPIRMAAEALTADNAERWFNLYRPTDPIGGAIGGEVDNPAWPEPLVPGGIETFSPVLDPSSLPPPPGGALRFPGDPAPEARGHSNYYVEPAYDAARRRLIAALGGRRPDLG